MAPEKKDNTLISLFKSEAYLHGIMIIVFKTDYALSFKNFNKDSIKKPTIYFVSDILDAREFAGNILYYCSFSNNFKSIAGPSGSHLIIEKEGLLNRQEIEELYYRGFNPLKKTSDGFCIWGQQILGASTEHNEPINGLSNYMAYSWAMEPKKPFDKASRFITLAYRNIIEIGHNSFTFFPYPSIYKAPEGIGMTPGNAIII